MEPGRTSAQWHTASKTSAGVVQVHMKYIRQYYNNDSFAPSPPSMDVYVRATTDQIRLDYYLNET